jgi:serine/threonine protein kinase/outer membrane protein assembly factor BamB
VESLAPDDPHEIGPYLLQGRLGTGGMGQVYLGRTADGTLAAVKVVHSRFAADPSFRQRFSREITVARAVQGRWVAALLDGDAQARRPWLATEYVAAPPLDRVVDDSGPLPEPALVTLAHRLAEALAQLHAQGVVHRDLKPSNVLVADDGPRLIDFGVARAIDATAITQTGMVVGTPAFMSPEQAGGADVGPPSDVFSLASVLVFAATGRGPFGHTTNALAMLRRISDDQPDLDGLPGRLRDVLEPCFAKDPADRPTAAALAAGITADAFAARSPLDPWDPTSIGPYRLIGRLGAGGMGHVYLGQAATGGRLAAVKVVHEQYAADRRFRERFAREIATARAVRGRRIAELLDADPDARIPWLATGYIAGPSLDQAVADRGALPEPDAVRLAAGLAEALDALHARGVVHRDLKPSNVLLADDGPKLIDFGIARAFDETALTQTGGVLGAPGYMSPEQAMGEEVGPPSDLFSFAAVVVFAATGRGPFGTSETPLALLRRVVDDPPDLTGLPQSLLDVVQPCLAKDPAERPTAPAMAGRLAGTLSVKAAAGQGGTRTLEPGPPEPAADAPPRQVSRRALLIGGAIGLAGIATAGGIVLATRTPSRPVRWTSSADRGAAAVTVYGNDPYMVDKFNLVHAFDPASGAVRWTFQLSGSVATPPTLQAAADTCYVESTGSGLCALDAASGQPRWTNRSAHLLLATDELLVCTASERVPVGVSHTEIGPIPVEDPFMNVQGLDPMSGATRWSFRLNVDELVHDGWALAAAGQVHLRSDSRIFTLNAAAGTLRWEQPRPAEYFDWAASRGGLFYATSTQVVRLDAATGASLWHRVLPAPTFDSQTPPSITCNDQSLFLASAYGQEAWDARSGEPQWHVDQPGFDPPRTILADWRINTSDGQISTSDTVILTETGSDSTFAPVYRVSARSTRDGDTLWTAPLDGVGTGGFDLALGADTLYVLPLDADRGAAVMHAIPII